MFPFIFDTLQEPKSSFIEYIFSGIGEVPFTDLVGSKDNNIFCSISKKVKTTIYISTWYEMNRDRHVDKLRLLRVSELLDVCIVNFRNS